MCCCCLIFKLYISVLAVGETVFLFLPLSVRVSTWHLSEKNSPNTLNKYKLQQVPPNHVHFEVNFKRFSKCTVMMQNAPSCNCHGFLIITLPGVFCFSHYVIPTFGEVMLQLCVKAVA